MPQSNRAFDLNLLFGVFALQMDFITRVQLNAAMRAWLLDKTKSLGAILVDRSERHALLHALVHEHLKQHGNDPQQSLAAVSWIGSVRKELEQLADPDLTASLAHLPAQTTGALVGAATSTGSRFRILRPHAKGGLGQVYVA